MYTYSILFGTLIRGYSDKKCPICQESLNPSEIGSSSDGDVYNVRYLGSVYLFVSIYRSLFKHPVG